MTINSNLLEWRPIMLKYQLWYSKCHWFYCPHTIQGFIQANKWYKPNFWVCINTTESCKNSHGAVAVVQCCVSVVVVLLANVKYVHQQQQQYACSGQRALWCYRALGEPRRWCYCNCGWSRGDGSVVAESLLRADTLCYHWQHPGDPHSQWHYYHQV